MSHKIKRKRLKKSSSKFREPMIFSPIQKRNNSMIWVDSMSMGMLIPPRGLVVGSVEDLMPKICSAKWGEVMEGLPLVFQIIWEVWEVWVEWEAWVEWAEWMILLRCLCREDKPRVFRDKDRDKEALNLNFSNDLKL